MEGSMEYRPPCTECQDREIYNEHLVSSLNNDEEGEYNLYKVYPDPLFRTLVGCCSLQSACLFIYVDEHEKFGRDLRYKDVCDYRPQQNNPSQ